jgi:hypothetical protein
MAEICIEGDDVVVQLGLLEKLGALHGVVRIPRSAVTAVRVVDQPFAEIRGLRFPGTGVPGVVALGTWRRERARDFVCVYRGQRGVVIDLDPRAAPYQRVIVSSRNPDRIRSLLGK